MFLAMGLQAEGVPDTLNGRLGELCLGGEGSASPMSAVLGFGSQRLANESCYLLIANGARSAWPWLVIQPGQILCQITSAPQSDSRFGEPQLFGDIGVAVTVASEQDDPGAGNQGLRHRAGTYDRNQLVSLSGGQR